MFTGIIEEVGRVVSASKKGAVTFIEIKADKACEGVKIGDSISVSGVCLTVVGIRNKILSFEAIPETIRLTTLKNLIAGDRVNLERALRVGDRMGGHFVTGHVDFVGALRSKRVYAGNFEFHIGVPAEFLKYVTHKGSVAIDGVSLTISDVAKGAFCVNIIPHTAKQTTLGKKHAGSKLNIELDMLAKRNK